MVGPSFGVHSHGSIAFLLHCWQLELVSNVYASNWHLQYHPPHHQYRIWSFWVTRSIYSHRHGSRSSPHKCPTLPPTFKIFIGKNQNSSHTVHLEYYPIHFGVCRFIGAIKLSKGVQFCPCNREMDRQEQANVS